MLLRVQNKEEKREISLDNNEGKRVFTKKEEVCTMRIREIVNKNRDKEEQSTTKAINKLNTTNNTKEY